MNCALAKTKENQKVAVIDDISSQQLVIQAKILFKYHCDAFIQ
jgi:hypothetical protein